VKIVPIDGSYGEGGGQVLRTSLALSLVTGQPFEITNIRAGRKKPGLMRQHVTSALAAATIGGARMEGAAIGSDRLVFEPRTIQPGEYRFSVGSAGSCTLVLQTVLPALLIAGGESRLILEGGTHNPWAPPFPFLEKAFLPLVNRMGPQVTVELERPGFFPAGGGRFHVHVVPCRSLAPLELVDRGRTVGQRIVAVVSRLPRRIGETEIQAAADFLGWDPGGAEVVEVREPQGPGNALFLEMGFEQVTEVVTGFGQKGVPARNVGRRAAMEAAAFLASDVPVGPHLADQLMIPLAMAGKGRFRTTALTPHATTNIDVIRRFLDVGIHAAPSGNDAWEVAFSTAS
jgi:RNA 3'-terminal phosphate cyclase (ATP)